MLDAKTIEIIKSTVPVLEVHGETITKKFYETMFKNHPELLNIFNHANQRQGKQPTALANAVYAAAAHIDRLEEILPVVRGIAQKHRALGIMPEHYPIVGENLLAAIKMVLGDAATDEILEAWGQAYGVIADVFISTEAEMYKEAEQQKGGWRGFRRFVVDRKVKESEVITSFYLKPEDGGEIASYKPGQYITVRVKPEGQEFTHLRHYSLSAAPCQPFYRISVKREDAVEGQPAGIVSTYLHERIGEGDVLELSAPAGDFTLDQSQQIPLVLLSGGVGLTPMISMLETALQSGSGREIVYIHAARSGRHHAMKEHVDELTRTHDNLRSYFIYETAEAGENPDKTGYIDLPWLKSVTDTGSDFYFCGPLPFMKAINRVLKEWGVPGERIHFEFFGPADSLEDTMSK
ncbi:NO-inducible flavohemoprotein [Paenibacillus macerans]|uniref:Flavohemoprotein n=1 Tax=Paenibacillus macerans TaxID=44252 RepID=A0A6N8EW06_PAEMA|nr:NO-inducible flavohemoprotein [Paenibacillus macerans]MUG22621.1 NO-inducible flavohemoprotein [Paenibacillus macerans]UMV46793.1 NO-inducible flavohemoprotein [Paenibacillus macerans]